MADGGDNEPEREDLVRRQVVLTVRCVVDVPVFLDEAAVRHFVQEHLCKSDLVMSLAERIAHDDEKGACNVCSHASVELVPAANEVSCLWLDSLPSPMPAPFRLGGDGDDESEEAEEVDEDDVDEDLEDEEEGDEDEDGEAQP
jgi:hypothetical protein